jgi:hypothetical protein
MAKVNKFVKFVQTVAYGNIHAHHHSEVDCSMVEIYQNWVLATQVSVHMPVCHVY